MAKSYIGAGQDQPIQAGFAGADQFARMAEREVQQRRDEDAKAQSLLKANRKVLDDLSDASTIKYEDLDARTIKMARNAQNRYQTKEYEIKRALERNPNDPRLLDEYDRNQQMLDAEIGALYNFKDYAGAIQSGIAENKFNQITGAQYLNNNTEMMNRLQSGEFDDAVPTDFFSAYRDAVPMSKMPAYLDYKQESVDFAKGVMNGTEGETITVNGKDIKTINYNYNGVTAKQDFLSKYRGTPFMETMQGVIGNEAYYNQKEGVADDRNEMLKNEWAHIDKDGNIAVSAEEVFKYIEDTEIKDKLQKERDIRDEKVDEPTVGQETAITRSANLAKVIDDSFDGSNMEALKGWKTTFGNRDYAVTKAYDDYDYESGEPTFTIVGADDDGKEKTWSVPKTQEGKTTLGNMLRDSWFYDKEDVGKYSRKQHKNTARTVASAKAGAIDGYASALGNHISKLRDSSEESVQKGILDSVRKDWGYKSSNTGVGIMNNNLVQARGGQDFLKFKNLNGGQKYNLKKSEDADLLMRDISTLKSITDLYTARKEQNKIKDEFEAYLNDRDNYEIDLIQRELSNESNTTKRTDMENLATDMLQKGFSEDAIIKELNGFKGVANPSPEVKTKSKNSYGI